MATAPASIGVRPAASPRLARQRELLGLLDVPDRAEHARRVHARAAVLHRQAAEVHEQAANLFELHAAEVLDTDPGRAAQARHSADREREAAALEHAAADDQQAKSDALA